MKVTKSFTFDAAHALTNYHGACERLHGHTYRLDVTIEGPLDAKTGMVVDFLLLKLAVQEQVLVQLDHRSLNDVLKNPSAELLAVWIWGQLQDLHRVLSATVHHVQFDRYISDGTLQKPSIPSTLRLVEIRLWETATSCITYNGDAR